MRQAVRCWAAVAVAGALAVAGTVAAEEILALASAPWMTRADDIDEWFAVTVDEGRERGCEAISIFRVGDGQEIYKGSFRMSPGRLAATTDLSLLLAARSNGIFTQDARGWKWCGSIYAVRRAPATGLWEDLCLEGQPSVTYIGGIGITPDNQFLLVATQPRETGLGEGPEPMCALEAFYVSKYRLDEIDWTARWLGPERGRIELDLAVAEIVFADGGRRAHLVTVPNTYETANRLPEVLTIDVGSMTEVAGRVRLAPIGQQPFECGVKNGLNPSFFRPIDTAQATLSPDGRYLLTNRWAAGELNVVDLETRRSSVVVTEGLTQTGGVAFNWGRENRGLIAVHGIREVAVYRWVPPDRLVPLGRAPVGPTVIREGTHWRGNAGHYFGPIASIAWSGSGDALIAAGHYESREEFVSWRVSEGGRLLEPLHSYGPCPGRTNTQNDILTINGLMLVPDPPQVPTATPSPTATPTATAPHTPTTTATATPTRPPAPIFLPLALRESCQEVWVYADVALVLDTSTSMNRTTRTGRAKLAATQDAAKAFVELMDFTPNAGGQHDQVAIIGFNDEAWIQQPLAGDAGAIHQAIDDLARRQHEGTRLDLAFLRGAEALAPERRLPGNTPVLVLLTDGLPNRVPTPVGGGTQEDTVLAAAQQAKGAGIRVYTIAIGAPEDTNRALLQACATDPSMYRYAPDAEDLGAIYTEIAYAVGCPKRTVLGRAVATVITYVFGVKAGSASRQRCMGGRRWHAGRTRKSMI